MSGMSLAANWADYRRAILATSRLEHGQKTYKTVSDLGPAEVAILLNSGVEELLVLGVAHALVNDDVVGGDISNVDVLCDLCDGMRGHCSRPCQLLWTGSQAARHAL